MDQPTNPLRKALLTEKPLQIVGVINAFAARLAQQAGFNAIYLSGAGVANANFALPDLGMTSLNDVLEEVNKITASCTLPLLVDVDTGWGSALNISRTFRLISRAHAAGAHIEDQTESKRCGHREGKALVSQEKMISRLKAALDGREDDEFMVIARTDSIAVEGENKALERAIAYEAIGVDAIFLEAATTLTTYHTFSQTLKIPILANITEFGQTPLFTKEELANVGVRMILYPLSAFRAMNYAAFKVYNAIRQTGTQQSVLNSMQTRQDLYATLNYETFEKKIDLSKDKED